jgi:hypothetical protein
MTMSYKLQQMRELQELDRQILFRQRKIDSIYNNMRPRDVSLLEDTPLTRNQRISETQPRYFEEKANDIDVVNQ